MGVQKGLAWKVTFKQRLKGCGISQAIIRGEKCRKRQQHV